MMNHDTTLGSTDPDAMRRTGSRRDALRAAGRFGRGIAVAALPLGLATVFRRAYAQEGGTQADHEPILNFALTLEYLENDFYVQGLATSGLIPASDVSIFQTIQAHEQAHVDFLENELGSAAVSRPTFDFTAGGAFDPFGDYATFTLLAQAFEDTGVRAYKGQAGALMGTPYLGPALTIHSVEARHAARVRRLNGLQGWIPFAQPGVPAAAQAVYAGEDATTQGGVNVPAVSGIGAEPVTEAWDEPLTMNDVLAIANQFIA